MSHHIFDLPVMMLGALCGIWADIALVQHFQFAKVWALAGAAPCVLIGGFAAFWMFHAFLDGLDWIDKYISRKKSRKQTP